MSSINFTKIFRVRDRMKKEAHMLGLRHPNIVNIYGYVCDETTKGNHCYALVTEYMEYGSIGNIIDKVVKFGLILACFSSCVRVISKVSTNESFTVVTHAFSQIVGRDVI